MDLSKLLKDKIEKQLDSWNAELEASEAKAKARLAEAQANAADAELDKELWGRINDLKDRLAQGREYLADLKDAGDEKAEQLKQKVSALLD